MLDLTFAGNPFPLRGLPPGLPPWASWTSGILLPLKGYTKLTKVDGTGACSAQASVTHTARGHMAIVTDGIELPLLVLQILVHHSG